VQIDDARTSRPSEAKEPNLKIGDLVELRSPSEILATLDERGRLDALPFMPEMLQFTGKRLRVSKRAFKTCDQVKNSGMYRMERTVHLEGVRCDGSAHGGCQAGCLIFWKEGWLKRVGQDGQGQAAPSGPVTTLATVETLERETRPPGAGPDEEIFSCQNTAMPEAAPTHIPGWDVRQYIQDVTSGNAPLRQVLGGLAIHLFNKFQWANRRFMPRLLLINGGRGYPHIQGRVEGRTPKETLDLQPGELVEVKSREEIFATLDQTGHNRGLRFDIEMLRYCGKRARVQRRVNRLIDEKTGKMVHIKGDCIVLDGFICAADFHQSCPRGIEEYWREIWLRRV
jgi:hypothetical protein